jgi:hypothetical protein
MLGKRPISLLLLAVALILLGAGIVRYWLKSKDVSESIKDRVITWVDVETRGAYKLSIGDIQIDPEKQSLLVSDILFQPTGKLSAIETVYQFRFENILIKNVDLSSFLESSLLDLSNVTIAGGEFEIIQGTRKPDSLTMNTTLPKKKFSKKGLRGVKIDSIQLSQLDLVYRAGKKGLTKLESVHLDLYNFHTDSLNNSTSSPLPVKRFRLSIDQLNTALSNNKYELKAASLLVNGGSHIQAVIKEIELNPADGGTLELIASKTPVQQDVYQLRIPEIVIDSLDYRAFLEDSMIRTPMIVVKEPSLTIFNDRSRPPSTQSKIGKNPHQLIQKLLYGLDIPLLQIKNGTVTYNEKNKEGSAIGKLQFSSISGNAGPIQKGVESKASLELDLTAKLMNQVPLRAHFYFPPGSNGQFSVKSSLPPFDLTVLNPVFKPLARVEIRTGKARSLDFSIQGNDQGATGRVSFLYEDLKIDVLKETEEGSTNKRPLLSMLANNLFIRTNNRSDDRKDHEFRVKEARDPSKSFFNLIWKTLFEGLKSSAGIRPKYAKPT